MTQQRWLSSRQIAVSISRVMDVASATPVMPSLGKNAQPKIKQALSTTFMPTALQCTSALMRTRSTLRITLRYTVQKPPNK